MTWDNVIGLILAVLLTGYLIAALIFPERHKCHPRVGFNSSR
jgi:K+-transporting ATPase KdpF subunit